MRTPDDLSPTFYDPVSGRVYASVGSAPRHARQGLTKKPPRGVRVLGIDLDGLSLSMIDKALGKPPRWSAKVFDAGGEPLLSQEVRLLLRERPPEIKQGIVRTMLREARGDRSL